MKRKWRIILYFGAGMLALFMIPALILGFTGKYRLLMKPRHVDLSKRSMKPQSNTVTADNNSSSVSGKSNPKEDLENILQIYAVDFYYPSMEYPDSADDTGVNPANPMTRKLPVVEIPFQPTPTSPHGHIRMRLVFFFPRPTPIISLSVTPIPQTASSLHVYGQGAWSRTMHIILLEI